MGRPWPELGRSATGEKKRKVEEFRKRKKERKEDKRKKNFNNFNILF